MFFPFMALETSKRFYFSWLKCNFISFIRCPSLRDSCNKYEQGVCVCVCVCVCVFYSSISALISIILSECFIEKLIIIITQPMKKFPAFKEPESSLPCSQNSALYSIPRQLKSFYIFRCYFS